MLPKSLRSGTRAGNVEQQIPTQAENQGNPVEVDLTQFKN